jgi:hypothetical protein
MSEHGARESEDGELLAEQEIARPIFVALKDLLMREFVVRGSLSMEDRENNKQSIFPIHIQP